jgi:hypothetical protein
MAKKWKKTPRKPQPPSDNSRFEMLIRADKDLNVTYRVLWLLVVLSHSTGSAYISIAKMADQLNTSERQIRNSLDIICAINPRLFRKVETIGVHRPNQYKRCILKGEKPEEFVLRAQKAPGMDICLGLHWVACSNGKDGVVEFLAREIWPVSEDTFRRARRKMDGLGYIKVDVERAGKPARYILNLHLVDGTQPAKLVEKSTTKPAQRTKVAKEAIDARAAAADREAKRIAEAEKEHRKTLAMELGLDMEGNESKPITGSRHILAKKEVLTPHKPFMGRAREKVLEPHRLFTGRSKKDEVEE